MQSLVLPLRFVHTAAVAVAGAARCVLAPVASLQHARVVTAFRFMSGKRGAQRVTTHRQSALPHGSHKPEPRTPTRAGARKTDAQSAHYAYMPGEKPSHPVVLALDIGTRNFAFCRMDAQHTVLDWGVWDLVAGVPGITQATKVPTIDTVHALVHSPLFKQVDHVVIENQLRGRMKLLEAYLQAFLYGRVTVAMPRAVHAHFKTATGKYRTNKSVAVEKVEELLRSEKEIAFVQHAKKKDDLCDAYLLARFYQEHLRHPREADVQLLQATKAKRGAAAS